MSTPPSSIARRAQASRSHSGENSGSQRKVSPAPEEFKRLNLIGQSPAFLDALALITKLAGCDATVLIEGETGTGKELAARAIHYLSSRADHPFIPVNCGALPDTLVENELFGHEKGAFTDAREPQQGIIAQAQGGTLFLDEIDAMSTRAQVVLLRFLQNQEYRPVGGAKPQQANLKIIAASHFQLAALVKSGVFRQDLLFRLNVLVLALPPLRERTGDAVLLAESFLRRFSVRYGQPEKKLHPEAFAVLHAHSWPGNVRELENLIHREYLLTEGPAITLRANGNEQARLDGASDPPRPHSFREAKARAILQFEKAYLVELLAETNGNLSLAAKIAGKERSAFGKLARKYGFNKS